MRILLTTCLSSLILAGCLSSDPDSESEAIAGNSATTGGSSSSAGGAPGANGGSPQAGVSNLPGTGGSGTGGVGIGGHTTGGASNGGAQTGGASSGGQPIAGSPSGGVAGLPPNNGGSMPGGASSGGASPTGGSQAGGQPSAGTANGGAAPTGGIAEVGGSAGASGGQESLGGANAGGNEPEVGGAQTGGAPPVLQVVTTASGDEWNTSQTLTEVAPGTANLTVNEGATAQVWEGFGGAFNEMGWEYLMMLSEADRNTALALLFGPEGIRFHFGRIPIGATDYAMDRYTLDEVPSGSTDPTMASFSIARDQERLIPFVKAAQAIKPDLHFWASPWTPPTWMKDGPFNDDTPFDGGTIKGDETTLGALAQYFVKFVQAYAELGIDIEMVSPQNEPGYSGTYPTCGWAPEAYAAFVGQHLGPSLASAGLDTKIMLGTFNGGTGDTSIISTVMGDPTASGFIDALGYQWGMQNQVASAQQYGVPVWQSEHKCGNYPWEGGFIETIAPNDAAYAVESWGLLRGWIKAGVSSYSTWNMILDTIGVGIDLVRTWPQNALLTVDLADNNKLKITPTYWVFRHLSQFVEPGATVVTTDVDDSLAFKNPSGAVIVVVYNSGAATSYVVSGGGRNVQFNLPGQGWATLVLPPAA